VAAFVVLSATGVAGVAGAGAAAADEATVAADCTAVGGTAVVSQGTVCRRYVVPFPSTVTEVPNLASVPAGTVPARELGPDEVAPSPFQFPITTPVYYVLPDGRAVISTPRTTSSPPAQLPAAPGIGAVTPGNGSAVVSWTAPADGGSPITGYSVQARTGGSLVASSRAAAGATSATVNGLVNGTAYTFTVSAGNANGTGPASAATPAVTPAASGTVTFSSPTGSFEVGGAALTRYQAAGGPQGPLGYPVTAQVCGLGSSGCYQGFQNGSIYVTPTTGARVVWGAIRFRWAAGGWEAGWLGYPTGDEVCGLRNAGCSQAFQGGAIYWTAQTGPHAVRGGIAAAWAAQNRETGFLGYPTTDEVCGLRNAGCYQGFAGGTVYWTAQTGPHAVRGAIAVAWAAQKWETGYLGYPTTDEVCGLRAGGCYQGYQGGSVFWSTTTGAHPVLGAIRGRWAAAGWEAGALGYPLTDELPAANGGRRTHFQNGAIFWSPATGAHVVTGTIHDEWAAQGWEAGYLGYPTSEEYPSPDVTGWGKQDFQGGEVTGDRFGAWSTRPHGVLPTLSPVELVSCTRLPSDRPDFPVLRRMVLRYTITGGSYQVPVLFTATSTGRHWNGEPLIVERSEAFYSELDIDSRTTTLTVDPVDTGVALNDPYDGHLMQRLTVPGFSYPKANCG
jgi:uncharacterized protein with LGFP repeats